MLGSGCGGVSTLAARVAMVLRTQPTSPHVLCAIPGVGKAKAAAVFAALELGRKLQHEHLEGTRLLDAQGIYNQCGDIINQNQEWLVCFFLGSRQNLLSRSVVSIGTVSASLIHPREVFAPAITTGASSIVLAHNHPSGSLEPSEADLSATRQIISAGEVVGIRLVDHLICTRQGFTSLRIVYPELFCYAQSV